MPDLVDRDAAREIYKSLSDVKDQALKECVRMVLSSGFASKFLMERNNLSEIDGKTV